MNLRDRLADASAGLTGVEAAAAPDGSITWSSNGVAFAVMRGDGLAAEFRLDPAVAAAATRTPDVTDSGRGSGWVAFEPGELDDHGADRAGAWFASAHRRIAWFGVTTSGT